jgi:hypothetical protein
MASPESPSPPHPTPDTDRFAFGASLGHNGDKIRVFLVSSIVINISQTLRIYRT